MMPFRAYGVEIANINPLVVRRPGRIALRISVAGFAPVVSSRQKATSSATTPT